MKNIFAPLMWTMQKESRLLSDLKGFGVFLGSCPEAVTHLELQLSVLTGLQQFSHKMVMILQRDGKVRRRSKIGRTRTISVCQSQKPSTRFF